MRFLVLICFFGLLLMCGSAKALTNVSSCTVISSPGYYVLNTSIINSSASKCIQITASDVVFDGAGFLIDGKDNSNTYGIYVYSSSGALSNITIENVTLTDWYYGIYFKNAENISIGNVTLDSGESTSITIENSKNTILKDVNVSNTNWGFGGIYIHYSENTTIINSIFSKGANTKGMWIERSNKTKILNTTIIQNSGDGIYATDAEEITVINSEISKNGESGIYFFRVKNPLIKNNIIYRHCDPRMGYQDHGIRLQNSPNGIIIGNNLTDDESGIYLDSSPNATVRNNFLLNTLPDKSGAYCKGAGITLSAADNSEIDANTIINHSQGIVSGASVSIAYSVNLTITNNKINLSSLGGVSLSQANNSIVSNNVIENSGGGHGLEISGYDITISSNIIKRSSRSGISISSGGNVTIKNNEISRNGEDGIYTIDVKNLLIENNTIYEHHASSYTDNGIELRRSDNTVVLGNNLTDNELGVYIYSSNNITIKNNIY